MDPRAHFAYTWIRPVRWRFEEEEQDVWLVEELEAQSAG